MNKYSIEYISSLKNNSNLILDSYLLDYFNTILIEIHSKFTTPLNNKDSFADNHTKSRYYKPCKTYRTRYNNSNTNNNNNVSSSTSSVETKNENINSSVNQNTNVNENNSNSNSRQVVTQRIKGQVSSAIAPSINSYSQLVCVSGSSASIQTNLFGIAKGSSIIDENCQRILLSKELAANGLQVASVSLLCQDKRVFKAMEQAGSYCPYKGLIGEEARIGWEQNPQDRPDWEDIKKEYKNLDVKAYKKKDFCAKPQYKSHKLCLD